MEYRGRNGKPAPGMLRSDMTPMDFLGVLTDDLASVPGAVGVNNHEGSLLTENREAMTFLMAELKARDLFFLDSLTSPKSLAYATAKEFGVRTNRRDVFLDNDSTNAGSRSASSSTNWSVSRGNTAAPSASAIPIRRPSANCGSGWQVRRARASRSYPYPGYSSSSRSRA